MKKLLLALILACSVGSAVAEKNGGFVIDKKAPTTLSYILNSGGDAQINRGPQCSQDCWDNRRICYPLPPGETFHSCGLPFLICIETCEGAGGLYN